MHVGKSEFWVIMRTPEECGYQESALGLWFSVGVGGGGVYVCTNGGLRVNYLPSMSLAGSSRVTKYIFHGFMDNASVVVPAIGAWEPLL